MPTSQDDPPLSAGDAQRVNRKLIADLRDANENLLLAGLRTQAAADAAAAGRARAEEATRRLEVVERELRDTAEFREQLLGIVGHDLRNPLGAITMASALLLHNDKLGEANARLVARIIHSSQRMSRMITDMLDFTRARLGGGLQLSLSSIDLAEICRNAVSELELVTAVSLVCEFDGDLTGSWDGDRLYQVFSNLAGNAVDYATPGTKVVIKAFVEGADVVAQVSNLGRAIPADLLPVIFEPFRRVTVEERSAGRHLGLGLYIASQIVLAHGGTLGARSADGTTTFAMRLPRGAPATVGGVPATVV